MHRSVALLVMAVGVASAGGCAHSGGSPPAARPAAVLQESGQPAAGAERTPGETASARAYTSPVLIVSGRQTGTLFLRAVPGASGTSRLHVTIAHSGYWVNFDSAVDLEGHSYPVTQLDQHVSCNGGDCVYYEDLAISVPETALERASRSGLVLRISGHKMTYVTQLPAGYVADFVDGLRQVAEQRTPAAAARPVPAAPAP